MDQEVKREVVDKDCDCEPFMEGGVTVKREPAWSTEEDSPDEPSAVYSTAQPMSVGSLLCINRSYACLRCSAAFVLVSSLELHLASVHGEPLPLPLMTESSGGQRVLPDGRMSTEETNLVGQDSAKPPKDEFVLKQEPARSMKEESPDQPSAVCSTVQPSAVCSTTEPSAVYSRVQLSAVYSTAQPSAVYSTTQPSAVHSRIQLKAVYKRVHPSAVYSTTQPSAVYSTAQPSAVYSTSQPLAGSISLGSLLNLSSTAQLSAVDRVVQPSAVHSIIQPPSAQSNLQPWVVHSILQPSAVYSTAQPTSDNTIPVGSVNRLELPLASVHGMKTHTLSSACSRTGTVAGKDTQTVALGWRKRKLGQHSQACRDCQKVFPNWGALRAHRMNCLLRTELSSAPRNKIVISTKGKKAAGSSLAGPGSGEKGGQNDARYRKEHVCGVCQKAFLALGTLKRHSESCFHTRTKLFCDVCHEDFASQASLETHLQSHIKPSFTCQVCKRTLPSREMLLRHKHLHKDCAVSCDVFPNHFASLKTLKTRKRIHHRGFSNPCTLCPKQFASLDALRKHMKAAHREYSKGPFECPDCNKEFHNLANFCLHLKKHSLEKRCPHCEKRFVYATDLNKHILSEHSAVHECDVCYNHFGSRKKLANHKRLHDESRPYKCPLCCNGYLQIAFLKKHIRYAHTPGKHFICEACAVGFNRIGDLDQHMARIHAGVKPIKCSFCEKNFMGKNGLERHMARIHAGVKLFKCADCEKSFMTRIDLEMHMTRFHAGVKPFKCLNCEKSFMTKSGLDSHRKQHHGEKTLHAQRGGNCARTGSI